MIYEWDSDTAVQNARKHAVSFEEAIEVFLDPLAITFEDPDHSIVERRFITIGRTVNQRLLFVAHADIDDDRIRMISGRATTRSETNAYQERAPKRQ